MCYLGQETRKIVENNIMNVSIKKKVFRSENL